MKLTDYFKFEFDHNIGKIPRVKPNETILQKPSNFYLNSKDTFFGGKDWQNYETDISNIPVETREDFILCLFTVSMVDYYYTNNYNNAFSEHRFPIPKFGWCGYGPHFEHPLGLLTKHFGDVGIETIISSRSEEIKNLTSLLICEFTLKDELEFLIILKNNITNIPVQFNDPIFFEFLMQHEIEIWKKIMKKIILD
jgi:hypothetical protein